jgi:hypothetical protein
VQYGAVTDDDLAADQKHDFDFDRLNRDFYSAEPADYFEVRWLSLMLMAGRPDDVLALLAEGVTYAHMHAAIEGGVAGTEGVRNFATMESQVLLHQICEALIRLYLAHVGQPACPWLELAREKNFRSFKERVSAELVKQSARALHVDVADIFLGPPGATALTEDRRAAAIANLTAILRACATRWLQDAHIYNSLKHGLAVVPAATSIAFRAEGSTHAHSFGSGPSLVYLESTKMPDSWKLTTQWIDVSESLALVQLTRMMIESPWGIARTRYTNAAPPTGVFAPVDLTPSQFRTPDRGPAVRWTVGFRIVDAQL